MISAVAPVDWRVAEMDDQRLPPGAKTGDDINSVIWGDSTIELLDRARGGDSSALDRLLQRYLPRLRTWASGRLPPWARHLLDTDDLVQDTLLQTLKRVDAFEPRRESAFQAYLRRALLNRIRDEIRRAGRRPALRELNGNEASNEASPLEETIGREAAHRYEAALERLHAEDREAIIARIEMGCSYAELSQALDKPTPDAARMTVSRALLRLAQEMGHETQE